MGDRARLIGMNHVAIEVGDLDEALELYARLVDFELRGRHAGMAFVDIGDQFLAISGGRRQGPDDGRHIGLVVDDLEAVKRAAQEAGLDVRDSDFGGIDVRDPWGNFLQFVDYRDIQFERTPGVRRKLGIEDLQKSEKAREQIRERGLE
jgi:catechol 2,3-dioxygenase-like lactoylglutathione lyase family enzyme